MLMKNGLTILFLLLCSTNISCAFEATLYFNATPSTSKIYFDGQLAGVGKATLSLERAVLVEVKIVNEGYITFIKSYRYGKGSQFAMNEGKGGYERGENNYTITLEIDPNYISPIEKLKKLDSISKKSDSINKFIILKVNEKYSQQESWIIVNKVISDYFDDLDESKIDIGTIKSLWQCQTIDSKKIRTRIIVKTEGDKLYKIKIQSEYSDDINASSKDDEKFNNWDRILIKYENLFGEFSIKLN